MTAAIQLADDPAAACASAMLGAALGGGHIVLTGGSTPRAAYRQFVALARGAGVDVSGATLWLGDERCVEPDDDRANYRMIKESLLDGFGGDGAPVIHRIRGELGPEAGAQDYESALRSAGPPAFDLLLLGVGPDGHIASLFPGQSTLDERERLVVGVPEAGLEPFVSRVSFTLSAIALAREVLVLATGEGKAPALAAAFSPDAVPDRQTPASLLPTVAQRLTVLVDGAAASQLPGPRAGGGGS